jgi:hypothetical protein
MWSIFSNKILYLRNKNKDYLFTNIFINFLFEGTVCDSSSWRALLWPSLRYYTDILLEKLRKPTKILFWLADLRAWIWTIDLHNTMQEW